ncbi:unnamed protein product [Schistosoma margrebowiei]|uniref:Uncharacterized protein n=1 Tax=Schistosoma margrebowiei TaxID=48269 RepID=A0A183MHF6_9TREM|nr:unnamed protein product [Schistosoma margrebowiei]
MVGGSHQEALNLGFVLLGTRQQGTSVILRELMLPVGYDPVSPSFTLRFNLQFNIIETTTTTTTKEETN